MRVIIKTAVERVLSSRAVAALARGRLAGRSIILAYHNVLPDGEAPGADRSLHIARRAFASHLDHLSAHHEVVPLANVLARRATRSPRPAVAITFDDAYAGAITAGVAELEARGLPATVFVAPALLGRSGFWWDTLVTAGGDSLPPDLRERALRECRGEEDRVQRWGAAIGLRRAAAGRSLAGATREELATAMRYPKLDLACHTFGHVNLASLSPSEARDEMSRSHEWLRERFDRVHAWIAYPYGLGGTGVEGAAREAGLSAGLMVSGGWMPTAGANPFALPRLNIPAGLSDNGFVMRLAGMLT